MRATGLREKSPDVLVAGLTEREREVLRHLLLGETNKEIAQQLECSVRTIDVHVSHILRKASSPSKFALLARFLPLVAPSPEASKTSP